MELLKNPDGQWTAALENLDRVVAAVTGEGGHEPTDEELRNLGVDPDVARSQGDDLPDILQQGWSHGISRAKT